MCPCGWANTVTNDSAGRFASCGWRIPAVKAYPVATAMSSGGDGIRLYSSPGRRLSAAGLGFCLERRLRLLRAGVHLDASGVNFRRLGYQDLQHTVLGRSLDRLRHDMTWEADRAKERAVSVLDPMYLLLGRVVHVEPFTLDRHQAVPECD